MFPLCVPLIQNMGLTIVVAQNKHQFRSIVYLIIAIVNVITTYLTVPYWGIYGAAVCTCISYIIGQGLVMNIYYYKVTGINIPLFWENILKMAIVPIGLTIVGIVIKKYLIIENWLSFLGGVFIFSCIYATLMYRVAFNQYEKKIFTDPLKKLLGKCI